MSQIIDNRKFPAEDGLVAIAKHACGIIQLLEYDAKQHPECSGKNTVSDDMVSLLSKVLRVSRACLEGESECVTLPYDAAVGQQSSGDSSQPYTPFETMIRSGIYTSDDHLVIRTLPAFHADYLNEMSRLRVGRLKAGKEAEMALKQSLALVEEMKSQSILGSCTKYHTRHRALTPGLFLCFCAGCGVCEYFEMMDHAECAVTPFRIFAERAWTERDLKAHQNFLQGGEWKDPVS